MLDVHCVPEDDAQFANCVRAVATHLRFAQSRRLRRAGSWEAPLRSAFGYRKAEARVSPLSGCPASVVVFRDGADPLSADRLRWRGRGPLA